MRTNSRKRFEEENKEEEDVLFRKKDKSQQPKETVEV